MPGRMPSPRMPPPPRTPPAARSAATTPPGPDTGGGRLAPDPQDHPHLVSSSPGTRRAARVRPSVIAHHITWAWRSLGYRCARRVHHVIDAARPVEEAGQQVTELDAGSVRHLERGRGLDRHSPIEVAVAAHPVPREAGDVRGDEERGVAVG